MRSVCVFCGSSPGVDPAFLDAAERLGRAIARSGRTLVYGGGRIGLMAALANAALAEGGEVVGVIPQALVALERAHQGLSELLVVDSMHERKAAMADRADAFVATAGGLGTLEELFEAWTWAQLGLHGKPLGLLEVPVEGGYFAPLLDFLNRAVEQRFVRQEHREMLVVETDPDRLLERLERCCVPELPKWIDPDDR